MKRSLQNATETLLKLKPQTYNKHTFEFDKFTAEEYSNASSNNAVFSAHSNCWVDQTELIENTIDEREEFPYIRRRLTEQAQKETGLIAQDIYYDCPELRHLISFPATQRPQKKSQPVATTHKTIRITTAQVGERNRRLYRTLKSFLCSSSQTRSYTKDSLITTLKSPI